MTLVGSEKEGRGTWVHEDLDDVRVSRSARVIMLVFGLIAVGLVWSYFAVLDEVSTGSGRVVPSMQEQVIQSFDGGILTALHVREDEVVEPGQILAQLDPTRSESNVDETGARYRAALASAARLEAEVNGTALVFPPELEGFPGLIASERELYEARRRSLRDSQRWLGESLELVRSELDIHESLSTLGATSNVEVLRLRRQAVELELQQAELESEYIVRAREELATARADVEALSSVMRGRADTLSRTTIHSPVRGIVKNIEVATIGGAVPPNGRLMEIVPLDDQLLIEARISPRDIAFIHPGQRANVKLTAYDYSIYGGLEGEVATISPDTIRDEANPEIFYYRVYIRTETDALVNEHGVRFPIAPGMVSTVDIHTGSKTVFDYLVKPLNRAREALRER